MLRVGGRWAAQESPEPDAPMDAGVVVQEAEQIVAARYRHNR